MEFNNIGDLLARFKKLKPTDTFIKEECVEVLQDSLGVKIDIKDISVQKNTLFLNLHPAIKTEIFLKKEHILSALKKRLRRGLISKIV